MCSSSIATSAFSRMSTGVPFSSTATSPAAAAAQQQSLRVYDVDPSQSHILAITHRAGLFSFLGHEHAILATAFSAALCMAANEPERSTLRVTVPTRALVIDSDTARQLAGLGKG